MTTMLGKVNYLEANTKQVSKNYEHIKNAIWRYIGYEPQRDNDEVDAYLLTYIYNKITDVFYKHDKAAK